MFGLLNGTIDRWLDDRNALQNLDWFFEPMVERRGFPAINLYKADEDYVAQAELPGFDKKDIHLEIKQNNLRIYGKRKLDYPEKSNAYLVERGNMEFDRTIKLEHEIDPEKVDAQYKDGVLTIKLVVKEEQKPKQILIS